MKKDRLYACHDVWGGETLFEGLPIRGAAQWSRDTAFACCCCCDGADAAATELMLLRRSCDGVAAATELRRPAPSRSFCASRLSDSTRRMRRRAFIFLRVDSNFNGRGPQSKAKATPLAT